MKCTACVGSGEDFNEGDPCITCGGSGDASKPGPMAGKSLALHHLHERVAQDMKPFYEIFGIQPQITSKQPS